MAREGALEDPAVPPDVGASQKPLPWPRGAPDVAGAGPDPDVPRATNGRRALLADSDTDVEEEEEGPDPDVAPPKRAAPDLPAAPDVGLRSPAPDVARLGSGPGALVVESDTDAEEEPDVAAETPSPDVAGRRALVVESDTDVEDPDVGAPGGPGLAPSVPESPDVGRAGSGRWALLGDSETDVEEEEEEEEADPYVRPRGRRQTPPTVPETPDVRLKMLNPDVWGTRTGCGARLEDSETDVEEAEADPDVRPARRWKMTQDVPETPDVGLETPNPDVGGLPGTRNSAREEEGGWDPDVATQLFPPPEPGVEEAEADPDVWPSRRWKITQTVPETPDVQPERPNPDVSGAKIGGRVSPGDSETDVEEAEADPDVRPARRRERTQNVPETPDVGGPETPGPDVGGLPGTRNLEEEEEGWDADVLATQLFPPPEPDVEEVAAPDPDVQLSKPQKTPPNVPETPDVGLDKPNPDVGGLPGTRNLEDGWNPDVVTTQLFPPPEPGVGSPGRPRTTPPLDPDVEEEAPLDPDVRLAKPQKTPPNVTEAPDVGLETPDPDVGGLPGTRNSAREEEGWDPDVATQLFPPPEPDVEEEEADPDVVATQLFPAPERPRRAPNPPRDPDVDEEATPDPGVEEEADPDVRPSKRCKRPRTVPEAPDVGPETPDPDVCGAEIGGGAQLEDGEPDVEEVEIDPDVRPSTTPPNVPEAPDVGPETPNPDVLGAEIGGRASPGDSETDVEEEAPDPDVRLSKPQKTPPNVPEAPDVGPETLDPDVGGLPGTRNSAREEEEGWDPDVATQLFLPPEPDVEEEEEADADVVATQLFPPPERPQRAPPPPRDPDVKEEEADPDVRPSKRCKTPRTLPEAPDVGPETPDPDVLGAEIGGRVSPGDSETDVEEEAPDPDVRLSKPQKTPPNVPEAPDVGPLTPDPDVGGLLGTRNSEGGEEGGWDPDVATQLFPPPEPDVGGPGRPRTAPTPPGDPDVKEEAPPDPDVKEKAPPDPDVAPQPFPPSPAAPDVDPAVAACPCPPSPHPDVGGAPGPAPEEAEAPPPPQVRRSLRLAESGGGGACAGPSPSPERRVQAPRPRPSPRPRPRESRSQSGPGAAQATPPVPIKGSGRGSVPAPPPQEEPAGGAKRSLRPRGALGPAPIRVLFTGLVASPELLVALGTLGGTEATSVTECSHLVTDGVRRTLKFLCALGRGVPIVTPEWLLQSSRGGRPLSPGPFLPQDLPRERRFGFRLRPALERARARPLLQGYQVHVTPSVRPCPEDMRDIVTCCGGTFLSQLPREHAPRVLVISCPQDRSLWAPALAAGLPLLSAELLLSGVLRQRLDIAQFLLAPLEPPNPEKTPQNPARKPKNPARKTPNPPPKPQNPAPNPPQTPPPSPPRTRSGRRPPQKTPNSGAPPKTPNPPQKTPKRPRGPSEDPDPDFGVREPPRTRSRRAPPQNHPRDPPSSGKTQKTPNPTQKPQNAPKQSRAPPGDPNPNFGVPDPPQEPPRTRSGRRPPPNSGTPRKTPNPPPQTTKRPQNAPNSTQKRPRGPHPDSGVPESPPSPPPDPEPPGIPQKSLKTSIK